MNRKDFVRLVKYLEKKIREEYDKKAEEINKKYEKKKHEYREKKAKEILKDIKGGRVLSWYYRYKNELVIVLEIPELAEILDKLKEEEDEEIGQVVSEASKKLEALEKWQMRVILEGLYKQGLEIPEEFKKYLDF